MNTLVSISSHKMGDRAFHHGEEIVPDLLSGELLDQWLDRRWCLEYEPGIRRSLYRLFAPFSGVESDSAHQLTPDEIDILTLPE